MSLSSRRQCKDRNIEQWGEFLPLWFIPGLGASGWLHSLLTIWACAKKFCQDCPWDRTMSSRHKAWSLGGSVIRGHMANGQARVSGSWRWGWTLKVVHRALFHSSTIGSFLPEQRCESMTSHSTQIKPRQRKKKWFLYLYFAPILLAHLSYILLSSSMYLCCVTFFSPSLATVVSIRDCQSNCSRPFLMNQKKRGKVGFC